MSFAWQKRLPSSAGTRPHVLALVSYHQENRRSPDEETASPKITPPGETAHADEPFPRYSDGSLLSEITLPFAS